MDAKRLKAGLGELALRLDQKRQDPDRLCAGLCEVCYQPFRARDLEDGVTLTANCCGRAGLCRHCRKRGNHDCDG